jgi:hypothetical protein
MVLTPPSNRPGKGKYQWLNAAAIAEAPDWLLGLIEEGSEALPDWLAACLASDAGTGVSTDPADVPPPPDIAEVKAALAAIPNPDLRWEDRELIYMATWAATRGTEEGRALLHAWGQKSAAKYVATKLDARWKHYFKSPPTQITAGTLFYHATQADPEWRTRHRAKSTPASRKLCAGARLRHRRSRQEMDMDGPSPARSAGTVDGRAWAGKVTASVQFDRLRHHRKAMAGRCKK